MRGYMQPRAWKVVKATGGTTFIECKSIRIPISFDEGEAKQLASLLTRKDREIARLKHQLQEAIERS